MCLLINTQPILLLFFIYFTTQLDNTGDLTALSSHSLGVRRGAESDGKVAEVERGLTREDRMTARIIKNVLPLLLPEGIAAIPPSLASNNSLVTRSAAPDESRLPTSGDVAHSEAAWPISFQCSGRTSLTLIPLTMKLKDSPASSVSHSHLTAGVLPSFQTTTHSLTHSPPLHPAVQVLLGRMLIVCA